MIDDDPISEGSWSKSSVGSSEDPISDGTFAPDIEGDVPSTLDLLCALADKEDVCHGVRDLETKAVEASIEFCAEAEVRLSFEPKKTLMEKIQALTAAGVHNGGYDNFSVVSIRLNLCFHFPRSAEEPVVEEFFTGHRPMEATPILAENVVETTLSPLMTLVQAAEVSMLTQGSRRAWCHLHRIGVSISCLRVA
jgi:hypothetical protein